MRSTTKQTEPKSVGYRLAFWGGVVLLTAAVVFDIWAISVNSSNEYSGWGTRGFQIMYGLPMAILAIMILKQRPGHPIAWMFLFAAPLSIINEAATEYYGYGFNPEQGIHLPFSVFAGWLAQWIWVPGLFTFLIFFPLMFPDGKILSPVFRFFFWGGVATCLGIMLWLALYPDLVNVGEYAVNPFGVERLRLDTVSVRNVTYIPVLFAIPAFLSLILRYRRGNPELRQQMKWLLLIGLFGVLTPLLGNLSGIIPDILLTIFSIAFPLVLWVSIMRYRLWNIDILINKSLVYVTLSAILALFLGGSLYLATGWFADGEGGRYIAITAAVVIFGLIFQPARYQLQRFVDRRFYNIQIDYQKAPRLIHELKETISSPTSLEGYGELEMIGEGGMAKVYKAHSKDGARPVAIKVLPERLVSDVDFSTRFRREAETIAKLEHPNIVDVYTYGEDGPLHYMVMEYLNGPDIGEYLAQKGRLTLNEAKPMIDNIAAALDYAHSNGLVHRDIKPSNIMLHYPTNDLGETPRAVLMDFGIAKLLDKTAITKTGGLLGTFDYIAPEQIQEASSLDHRADIYSFGVLVFQMLTGRLPFEHSTPAAALIAHISQPPPHPRELEPDLPLPAAEAILKALEKDPAARFGSAGEFARALTAP